jgi:uncharacterized spore protein YtfJ
MAAITASIPEASELPGVRRVYGEPYQKNGVTVIPAARILGGMASGTGPMASAGDGSTDQQPSGSGTGIGMTGSPAGAIVIKGDDVRWVPAIDINRIVLGMQIVSIVLILAVRSISRARLAAN